MRVMKRLAALRWLSNDLNLLDTSSFEVLASEVIEIKKMLASFVKKLRADR